MTLEIIATNIFAESLLHMVRQQLSSLSGHSVCPSRLNLDAVHLHDVVLCCVVSSRIRRTASVTKFPTLHSQPVPNCFLAEFRIQFSANETPSIIH